ncbi:MAG: MgtC/SapB family protein [Phycisphaerales bacterium]|nr:MAG: MgtC/SapB family protein [Phycisphaerales bacterium]
MNWLNELFSPVQTIPDHSAERLVLVLLVGFIVGQLNAWCYKWTHRGVSYSRTFTQALVLIAIVAAMSMSLVASNALIAVGLLGGLAIIRFRTVVRDARDTAYVFLCLICGMAAGFGYYGTAMIGSLIANLAAVYMHFTGFGAWHAPDSLLRFQIGTSSLHSAKFEALLSRFCRKYSVISVDESPASSPEGEPVCQCAYKLRLRDTEQGPDLIAALKETFRIDMIHLLVEREYEEVA